MRRMQATMLLPLAMAMALAAAGTCQAQSRAGHAGSAAATPQASPAAGAGAVAAEPETDRDATPRSAFGKVMAVMISALQHQPGPEARQSPQPHVRTSATGTPLGIDVGISFRDRADAHRPAALPAAPAVDEAIPPPATPRELARTGPAG